MNKQLVNLIGALACAAILGLGLAVVALPLFSAAGATAASADDVAAQNRVQQTVLDTLTAQAADMSALESEVAELRAEIPEAAHLDDVLLLAIEAASAHGGTVTSVTPATAEEFAVRVAEAEAGAAAPATPDPAATPAPDASAPADDPEAASVPAAEATGTADAPQQVAVTVVVDAPDVAAATRIVDDLRAGPRLVAITDAAVTTPTEGGVTLTATLLAFYRP